MSNSQTYKLTKKLYVRKDSEWQDRCKEDQITFFKHKGNSAECVIEVLPSA